VDILAIATEAGRHAVQLAAAAEEGEGALFFVLDRYGAPHVAFLSDRPDDPAIQDEFLDWLFGIELECPE